MLRDLQPATHQSGPIGDPEWVLRRWNTHTHMCIYIYTHRSWCIHIDIAVMLVSGDTSWDMFA